MLDKRKLNKSDDSFASNYLQQETDLAKILAGLDNYIYKLFNNLEANKCSPRLWNFEKYKISALEHGLVQCFHDEKDAPMLDTDLESGFKEQAVKENGWRCKAPNCGCDPAHIFDTKLACIQHLQSRFGTYVCMGCSFKFNSRSSAVCHGRQNCIFFTSHFKEPMKAAPKIRTEILKTFSMEMAKHGDEDEDEDEDKDEDEDQAGENEYSFASFIEFAVKLTTEAKLRLNKQFVSNITSLSDFDRFQLFARYFILKRHLAEKFSSSTPVEISGSHHIIYHDKKHAFHVLKKESWTPIACWDLKQILTNSWYKRAGRYYCDYELCSCDEYSSPSKIKVHKHIQNKNFLLACRACNLGFRTQCALENHFKECELPQLMQIDVTKRYYLAKKSSSL